MKRNPNIRLFFSQVTPEGRYHFKVVGDFTPATATLKMNPDLMQWDPRMTQLTNQGLPESVCSYPCNYDEVGYDQTVCQGLSVATPPTIIL